MPQEGRQAAAPGTENGNNCLSGMNYPLPAAGKYEQSNQSIGDQDVDFGQRGRIQKIQRKVFK
jgi:hypothetical protein